MLGYLPLELDNISFAQIERVILHLKPFHILTRISKDLKTQQKQQQYNLNNNI